MSDYTLDNSAYERLERENAALKAVLAEIVAFTAWAKDTDLSGDDWLTELRHPEQVTAKMVYDMATKGKRDEYRSILQRRIS